MKKLIGKKLKTTRLQHDQTIQDLADRSGVSPNMISRVERGLTIPSVKILMKLAAAFGMSIGYFVEEAQKGVSVVFTPQGGGEPIFFFKDKQQITSLTQGLRDPSFTVFCDTIETGCSSGDSDMVHVGEEFIYVLDGCLEFLIQGKTYVLAAGDSLSFKAPLPHQWRNIAEGPTRVLWVISPSATLDN
jgi:transcriptional regulator with XRE-family HTH domain